MLVKNLKLLSDVYSFLVIPQIFISLTLCNPWTVVRQAPLSTGKNTKVDCHFLLQGIFPTQGSNPCLPHLLHWPAGFLPLCHLGSPLLVINRPLSVYILVFQFLFCFLLLPFAPHWSHLCFFPGSSFPPT